MARDNGSASPFYKVRTKRHNDGKIYAQANHVFTATNPVDARYRVEVRGQRVNSGWVRVDIPCQRKPAPVAKFIVEDAAVRISKPVPNRCPQNLVVVSRVRTNRPGPVAFRVEEGSGRTSQTFRANSVKQQNGRFVAVHKHKIRFNRAENRKLRVTVNGHRIASQWRAVNVTCAASVAKFIVEDAAVRIAKPVPNRCPQNVIVTSRVRTN